MTHTFANLRIPPKFEGVLRAFKSMIDCEKPLLLVYGGTGNAKSWCCEALVMALYDKGLKTKRDRWSDIVRHLKELMGGKGGYEAYFNEYRARQRLIIDDVGSGSTLGTWEWGELEDIIDYRWEKRLFTVITSNLDGKQIPPRILSRFKDKSRARMILNEVPDQRGI